MKLENLSTKQKFFLNNQDIFGKYFENGDYKNLVLTNIDKVEKIIKEKSTFLLQDKK